MNKKILLAIASLCLSITASAEEWIDVTSKYITNPSFVGNSYTGWSGTEWGSASPKENAEHYYMTYDTYQVITGLEPGKYRLSLNAFYRMGSYSNDYYIYSNGNASTYQYAQLYATSSVRDYYTQIQCASSGKATSSLGGSAAGVGNQTGWWQYEYYIPDNMEAAYYWFQAGYYKNTLECQVGSDGQLQIGIRKSQTINSDWTCCDDWKLEYWGNVIQATSIQLSTTSLTMVPSQTTQLIATVLPENATYQDVTWSSSNTSVATVDADGNITALAQGTTSILAQAKDGSGVRVSCAVTVKAPVSPSAENITINEIMAANVDVYRDPSTNYGSWVELYNPTSDGIKLGGLYVTDDANNLKKHKLVDDYGALPGNGFAILNFDHFCNFQKESFRQIDDKLDSDGGTIIISDGTNILAEQTYPAAIGRVSYARTSDGGDTWGNTGSPTPGASNASSAFATQQLAAPVPDLASQLIQGSITLTVSMPSGATLRYTTDGTTPTLTNGETSTNGVFSINGTTCLRFRAFQDGMLPSTVVSRSFIQNNGNEPFPIISIVADNKELFDTSSEYGVYTYSNNGRPGNGQTSNYNGNMEWDRPVHFDYITTDNQCLISQQCDFSACGGWSRAYTPHAFKLKANKIYDGLNSLDATFFAEKPYNKHKSLQIRNGGSGDRLKDASLQRLVASSGLYLDYQAWQPAHVYVNGKAYDVLNIREPNNKHNGYSNYGIDMDYIEQFEIGPDSGYVKMEGAGEQFQKLYDLSKTATSADSYAEICKIVDVDEFVNYLAVEFCYSNWDWPQNNVKGYCNLAEGADNRLHFVIMDLDGAFNNTTPLTVFAGKQNYTFDNRHGYDYSTNKSIEGTRLTKENPFVTIVLNLLNNSTFKKKFIDAFMILNHNVITPERAKTIISEAATMMSQGGYLSFSASNLYNNVTTSRQTSLDSHIQSYFGLSTAQSVTLKSNVSDGSFLINGQQVPCGNYSGKLFSPVTLTAKAPAGYIFKGWKSASGDVAETTEVFPTSSTWKYNCSNLDGTTWTSADYTDSSWSTGTAPLGYGKNANATNTLTKNQTCYYFRNSFELASVAATDIFALNYTIDDGMVVYVNGKEAGRYNMPSGTTSFSSVASTYANNNPDTGSMTIDASLFKAGTNVIAVEVHNNQASSSDIMWAASLQRSVTKSSTSEYISTQEEYTMPSSGTVNLTAEWEKVNDDRLYQYADVPVKINEVSAANDVNVNELFKKDDWVELYNTTDTDIDAAGLYLSDNAKKPQKYQITASNGINTIIPAHGTLLVWCSGRTAKTQVHASFKLSNKANQLVMLTSSDDFVKNNAKFFEANPDFSSTFSDTLTYNAMGTAQSVGRYPDGATSYYLMNCTTIDKSNALQGSDTLVGTDYIDTTLYGDVDGDGRVTKIDAALIMKHFIGALPTDVTFNAHAADINKDSKITINDANITVNKAK